MSGRAYPALREALLPKPADVVVGAEMFEAPGGDPYVITAVVGFRSEPDGRRFARVLVRPAVGGETQRADIEVRPRRRGRR